MKEKTIVKEDGSEVVVDFYSFVDIPNCNDLIGVDENTVLYMGIS